VAEETVELEIQPVQTVLLTPVVAVEGLAVVHLAAELLAETVALESLS
jgi:hypothetical protein